MSWFIRFSAAAILGVPFASIADNPKLAEVPIERAAVSGKTQRISFYYSLNPDCSSRGEVEIRVTSPPTHGATRIETASDFPNYDRNNPRFDCDRQPVQVRALYYTSAPGFSGPDALTLQALYPDGNSYTYRFNIDVWPEKSVEVVPAPK